MSRITVPGHIYREDRLAVLHVPGVFKYQMAGATLWYVCLRDVYSDSEHDEYDSSDNTPQ